MLNFFQQKKPLSVLNQTSNITRNITFSELGRNFIILPSIKGEYGVLFENNEKYLQNEFLEKGLFFSWVITSSIVIGMFYVHLILGCNPKREELEEFQDGVKYAYLNLTNNGKKMFTEKDNAEIESYLAIGNHYARLFLDEINQKSTSDAFSLDPGGSKSTGYIVNTLYSLYKIPDQTSNIEVILEKNSLGFYISSFSISLLKSLKQSIRRNI